MNAREEWTGPGLASSPARALMLPNQAAKEKINPDLTFHKLNLQFSSYLHSREPLGHIFLFSKSDAFLRRSVAASARAAPRHYILKSHS